MSSILFLFWAVNPNPLFLVSTYFLNHLIAYNVSNLKGNIFENDHLQVIFNLQLTEKLLKVPYAEEAYCSYFSLTHEGTPCACSSYKVGNLFLIKTSDIITFAIK